PLFRTLSFRPVISYRVRHPVRRMLRPFRPPSGDQPFPVLRRIQRDGSDLFGGEKENVVWGVQYAGCRELFSQRQGQMSGGGGKIHEMVAVRLAQGEESAESPVPPSKRHPVVETPSHSSADDP